MEREAWKLAHLLSPWSKKPLRPKQFLDPMTKDEKIDELFRRMEKQRG